MARCAVCQDDRGHIEVGGDHYCYDCFSSEDFAAPTSRRSTDVLKRKGPAVSANSVKSGSRRRGNDGKMWTARKMPKGYQRWVRAAEGQTLTFQEWSDQEMLTHGPQESFDDWLDDELDSHGDDITLSDWGHHELDSHLERYSAETAQVHPVGSEADLAEVKRVAEKHLLKYFSQDLKPFVRDVSVDRRQHYDDTTLYVVDVGFSLRGRAPTETSSRYPTLDTFQDGGGEYSARLFDTRHSVQFELSRKNSEEQREQKAKRRKIIQEDQQRATTMINEVLGMIYTRFGMTSGYAHKTLRDIQKTPARRLISWRETEDTSPSREFSKGFATGTGGEEGTFRIVREQQYDDSADYYADGKTEKILQEIQEYARSNLAESITIETEVGDKAYKYGLSVVVSVDFGDFPSESVKTSGAESFRDSVRLGAGIGVGMMGVGFLAGVVGSLLGRR